MLTVSDPRDMNLNETALPEVFSGEELARAAGVSVRRVTDLMASGVIRTIDGEFITQVEATRVGQALVLGVVPVAPPDPTAVPTTGGSRPLFTPQASAGRHAGMPLAVSSMFHLACIAGTAFITTMGLTQTQAMSPADERPPRLVYLLKPGPGGGGGGGGLRQPAPPPRAKRLGASKMDSPLPVRTPPKPIEPVPEPVEPPKPPPLKAEQLPAIVAPIVTAPANDRDLSGVLEQTTAQSESRGPGSGGGVGSGQGTGLGDGDGSGIGPGSGGGIGGGPYRPGSGVAAPRLLHEVKPDYTEEARRRSVEGDVVLEIIVRRDGTVGQIRVLETLGYGLDQRATEAVRQWRFAPARRLGNPVEVVVEVAVEFKLR